VVKLSDERAGALAMLFAAGFGFALCNTGFAELENVRGQAWPFVSQIGMGLFFALIGLELLAEFDDGLFKRRLSILVPTLSAFFGVLVPAIVFIVTSFVIGGQELSKGWPIVTATDVSFALMAFSLLAKGLPTNLRAFLLSFAVIDDIFASVALAVGFARWDALIPLFSTVSAIGIALVLSRRQRERVLSILKPTVTWFVLPVFGFFAMQIRFEPALIFAGPAALLIPLIVVRPITKWLGVYFGAKVGQHWVPQSSRLAISDVDLLRVSSLAGIGFTVSLLAADLAFGVVSDLFTAAAALTVVAALVAVALAAIALKVRRVAK